MSISQGVVKRVIAARQTAKGTLALTSGGQILRREQATFELKKAVYNTASEINSRQQTLSSRHGEHEVAGKLTGIFSPGTYSDQIGAILRRDFAAVTPVAGLSITIAGSGPTYTLTEASGSYLTDGFRVGMVVRLSAGAFNAANINRNLLITALTPLVMTVQPVENATTTPMVAEGPIATATITAPGKVTFVPSTGHTNVYYTFEEWYPDVPTSERNQDCKIAMLNLSIPGMGNSKLDFTATGLDQTTATTQYFTTPATESTSGALLAASGLLFVGGVQQAVVTDLKIAINGNEKAADGVLGGVIRPDVFRGKVDVTGSFTAYFNNTILADGFRNETDVSLVAVMGASSGNASDFVTVTLPVVKTSSSTPDDGETGLKRVFNFNCIYNGDGSAGLEQTVIQIQDSLAP
jgi:hypothetical protein